MNTEPMMDLREVVERIDMIMRELETLRRQLTPRPNSISASGACG